MKSTVRFVRTFAAIAFLMLAPLSAGADASVSYSPASPPGGFTTYRESTVSGPLSNYNSVYGANLKADALANGNQYAGAGGTAPNNENGSNSYVAHYFNHGYPDNVWGGTASGGSQYVQTTLNRLCYLLDTSNPDSTATGSGTKYSYVSGSADDNTLLYSGSAWYLLENDKHYSILGLGGTNAGTVLKSLMCTSYALPAQTLTANNYSITSGASVTLTWSDPTARDATWLTESQQSHSAYYDLAGPAATCTSSGFSLPSTTRPVCDDWESCADFGQPCSGQFCNAPRNDSVVMPSSGSVTVSPSVTTTYTYTCTNANGTTVASATVNVASACAANYGNSCNSSANSCGQTNSGTIQCNGSCSASTPANPANYGNACASSANACGTTNSGTIQCNGSCSASAPANPAGYGNACTSAANGCGQTAGGTIQCDGSCSAVTPSNNSCPVPSTSVSTSPNPVPNTSSPSFTIASTNGAYCSIRVDHTAFISDWSFGPGTVTGPSNLSAGSHEVEAICYNSTWTSTGNGWATAAFTVTAAPTASVSVSPSPVPYNTSPTHTVTSTNAAYCALRVDWNAWTNAPDWGFTSGNFSGPSSLSAGSHESEVYCYNSTWTAGSGWQTRSFTVSGPPTATLTATPSTIPINTSSSLAWGSTNSFSCTGSGFSTGSATSGSVSVSPTVQTAYGVTCTSSGGSTATANATVTVTYPDLTAGSTSFSNTTPTPGTNVTFSSTASNIGAAAASTFPNVFQVANQDMSATVAMVSAGNIASLASNASTPLSASYTFASQGTYQVRACANENTTWTGSIPESNSNNNCGAWQQITVSYPAVSGSCTVSPAGGSPGDTFTWTTSGVSGGTGVYSYSWSGTDSLSGSGSSVSKTYSTTGNKSGTVTVTSGSQSTPVTCTAPGGGGVPYITITQPPSVILTATPSPILAGSNTTLTWSSQNATTCTGTNFSTSGAVNNSTGVVATPGSTTTYTIACTNPSSSVTAYSSASVTVVAANLSISASPFRVRTGETSTLNWSASGSIDSCTVSGPSGTVASCAGAPCVSGSPHSVAVTVNAENIYTLSCTAGSLTATATTSVKLIPKPIEI